MTTTHALVTLSGPTIAHAVPNEDYRDGIANDTLVPMGTMTDRYGEVRWLAICRVSLDNEFLAYTSQATVDETGEICAYADSPVTLAHALA